ncbi:MAG: hypothetical protein J0M12_04775 [Deltaproteobacteria bacterium]|nr:hypothetical protein [Deltaproteobacteria bacterium]
MARAENAHLWLAEPLMEEPSFIEGAMFGCAAIYLRGLMVLVLADSEEPWNGILLPTVREHHDALLQEYVGLVRHPILGKWLYLDASDENFEPRAQRIVRAILAGDPRFGIEPGEKKNKKKRSSTKRRAKPRTKR